MAATDVTEALDRIGALVDTYLPSLHAPGVAVGLTDRDRLLGVVTRGLADSAAGTPIDPDTRFQIGSIGKSFTAIVALQEAEARRLDLHTPVTRYVPWFATRSGEPITLHHLLTHTSGLPLGTDFTGEVRHGLWALREMDCGFTPGERFHYSNDGYKLVGLVLEHVTGRPIRDLLDERVLRPLGMHRSEAAITHDTRGTLATGHVRIYDDRPPHVSHPLVPAPWCETTSADGSIVATASDLCAYARMLLNRGASPGGRLLSAGAFELLSSPYAEVAHLPSHRGWYGYGLDVYEERGRHHLRHAGGMIGFSALMTVDVDAGLAAVMLVNGDGERDEVVDYAIACAQAAATGADIPEVPPVPDPGVIEDAEPFAGDYRSATSAFTLRAVGPSLVLQRAGERIRLERWGEDAVLAPHPELGRYVIRFGREGGRIVEAFHGPDWYVNDGYRGPAEIDPPPDAEALTGHYRSWNPWTPNFRIVARKGRLVFSWPMGEGDHELAQLDDGSYRVGAEPWRPDRIRFDSMLDGVATRAIYDAAPYYRTFTP